MGGVASVTSVNPSACGRCVVVGVRAAYRRVEDVEIDVKVDALHALAEHVERTIARVRCHGDGDHLQS